MERQGWELAKNGFYEEALVKYQQVFDPSFVGHEDGITSPVAIQKLHMRQGHFDLVLQEIKKTIDRHGQSDSAVDEQLELGASLEDYFYFDGWMEEVRLSKGIARYDGDFTPSIERHKTDERTQLLLRADKQNLLNFKDYSSFSHGIEKLANASPDSLVYKFERTFAGGVVNRDRLSFPGPSIFFNGLDGYLRAQGGLGGADMGKARWTIGFWIKPLEEEGSAEALLSQVKDSQNYALLERTSDHKIGYRHVLGAETVFEFQSQDPLKTNLWQYVQLIKRDGDYELYLDGRRMLVARSEGREVPLSNEVEIGRIHPDVALPDRRHFHGLMDEVTMWGFAVTSGYIQPKRQEATDYYGLDFRIRESFLRPDPFYSMGYGTVLHVEDGVFPEEHDSPLDWPHTRPLKETLEKYLRESSEIHERTRYVDSIKHSVRRQVEDYMRMSDVQKALFASGLGLGLEEQVALNEWDVEKILEYLDTRSLHFGQSAFLSLESLLDQKGVRYAREDLATRAILIDILSGVLTPLDENDLVLSLFSLQKVARHYGVDLSAAQVSWADLESVFRSNPKARLIAHISGNHYIVLTGITQGTITYIDPGIGRDKHNETLSVTKEGFLGVWKGHVLFSHENDSAIPGMGAKRLSAQEAQSIRGAFWGSLLNIAAFLVAIALTIATAGAGLAAGATLWSAFMSSMQSLWVVGLKVAGVVASIAEGDWVSAVSGAVSLASAPGDFLRSLFKGATDGLAPILGEAGRFFGNIFQGVVGVVGRVTQGIGGFLESFHIGSQSAQFIAQTAVHTGLDLGISLGLRSLGLNPQLSGLLSHVATGAIVGAFNPKGNLSPVQLDREIRLNIFDTLLLTDIGTLGRDLELDDSFTQIIGTSLSALQGNLDTDPQNTTALAFQNILPDLSGSLAQYGINTLSTSLGLDPRISSIIGLPIAGAIGRSFDAGRIVGEDLIQSVVDGLTGGALQFGLDFAIDELDTDSPLLESLASAALTRSVSSFLDPNGNLIEDLLEAAGDFSKEFLGDISSTEFMIYATQHGYENALEAFATNIFSRQALEEIHDVGGIAQIISGRSELIDFNGMTLTKVNVTSNEGFVLDQNSALIGTVKTINGIQQASIGQFDISNGTSKLINGTIRQVHPDGSVSYIEVRNGKAYRLALKMPDVNDPTPQATVIEVPCEGGEGTCYRFDFKEGQETEPIWDWEVVENYDGELTINGFDIIDGLIFTGGGISVEMADGYGQSLNVETSGTSLSDVFSNQTTNYLFGNGFENEVRPEDTPDPLMEGYIHDLEFTDSLITGSKKLVVYLYEMTGLITNAIDWTLDFNPDLVTLVSPWITMMDRLIREVTKNDDVSAADQKGFLKSIQDRFRAIADNSGIGNNLVIEVIRSIEKLQSEKGQLKDAVAFAHSGFTAPVLAAIETMQYDVETVLIYEGPHPDYQTYFTNPNLKRIIHVMGSNHGLADSLAEGDATVPFLGWAHFTGSNPDFKNINIEIEGAFHSDYSYDPAYWEKKIEETVGRTPLEQEVNRRLVREQQERNREVNLFMRDFYEAALDPNKLSRFLDRPDITLGADGIYKVDLDVYHSDRS